MSQERPPLLQVYTHFTFSNALVSHDRPPLLQFYTHFKFSRAFVSQDRPLLTTNGNGNRYGKNLRALRRPRSLAAPDDKHHGVGNPLSGMIADPERHARNSLFRDLRHGRPLGGRRQSPLISAHHKFFLLPSYLGLQYEIAGPYSPL
jgi:hypothetical protein